VSSDSHATSIYMARHGDMTCELLAMCALTWSKSRSQHLAKGAKLEGKSTIMKFRWSKSQICES
jgi:hypothetical protein